MIKFAKESLLKPNDFWDTVKSSCEGRNDIIWVFKVLFTNERNFNLWVGILNLIKSKIVRFCLPEDFRGKYKQSAEKSGFAERFFFYMGNDPKNTSCVAEL